MDERVRTFIQQTVRTILGLDVVLFFQAYPNTFDTAGGLALRLRHDVENVEPALARLADQGILEVHLRADGQYRCYSLVRDPKVWNLLCLVSEAYLDDPRARSEIAYMLVRQQREDRATAPPPEQ